MSILVIAIALLLAAWLAFSRRLAGSVRWQATVTPLASIMGSGFLVSAPLLAGTVGNAAVFCMAGLLVVAFFVGSAIRFNIRYFEPIETQGHGAAQDLGFLSRIVLAGAYFISVTYYLQLLAAFLLHAVGVTDPVFARLITSALLVIICGVGIWRGLAELSAIEKYAVALNLGMIGALLAALAIHNLHLAATGRWALAPLDSGVDFGDLRVLLGLLIVVQGFETSRYLGEEYDAETRIATMRLAQFVSTAIYLVFIALATVLFRPDLGADVTAVIEMSRPVAAVLPILLAVAAIGSQFSAAVADASGAGGLTEDITHRRLPERYAYLLLLFVTVSLTWVTDVTEVIAYASRAFALFYAFQCAVAFVVAWSKHDLAHRTVRLLTFAVLTVICLLVFALGVPAG